MTPGQRQSATLADLDQRINAQRRPGPAHQEWLRRETLAGLEGRRRIVVRHAPRLCGYCRTDHAVCTTQDEHTWPCADWTDATAGLDPHPYATKESA